MSKFELRKEFVNQYKDIKPDFGFNGLGELTYSRTYSRIKPDGTNERWFESVERVVNATYSIQKSHIINNTLGWDEERGHRSAEEMYDRIFWMKFLPPGRGIWAMGTETVERHGSAALNNCGFVSTKDLNKNPSKPFGFLMDMSMLGVGIGFDVKGEGEAIIYEPCSNNYTYEIPDSREGWVQSVELLIDSYLLPGLDEVKFDYSLIRKEGEPIKGFGGVASGPEPLKVLHNRIREIFKGREGETITITDIVDIMNLIGCCVIAGNVRRTAEIVIGPHDREEYTKLKDYKWNHETGRMEGYSAHRSEYGWTSNNSVFGDEVEDWSDISNQIAMNGEPGVVFLDNIRKWGRTGDLKFGKKDLDARALGVNPCAEQSLENFELCCLVETFPTRAESKEDYLRTLKFAYLYGKTVTLLETHCVETNRVLMRNRRIGTSMSGIAQFIDSNGKNDLREWCDEGYEVIQKLDRKYSEFFCIPLSIKTTTVKPSGTVSLLAGVTPGIHYPESNFYIRRMRVSMHSPLVKKAVKNGYYVEPDKVSEGTIVIEIPVKLEGVRSIKEVSIWEQVANVELLQRYWSDNMVSNTINFHPHEAKEIPLILDHYSDVVKTLSFLPYADGHSYPQMPYEAISEAKYEEISSKITSTTFDVGSGLDGADEKFCGNDGCTI